MTLRTALPLAALLLLLGPAAARADRALRRTPIVVAVEKARPSVVNIRAEQSVLRRQGGLGPETGDEFFDRMFDQFFGSRYTREEVEAPLGSGFILDKEGYVVTNEHVIRRAAKLRVSLADSDKKTYEAEVICADPEEDIALLRIKADRAFTPVTLGRSVEAMLGETVIALGNPFGFENSVSSGIISALERDITAGEYGAARQYHNLMQTSALINPGNSGGPLVNLDAELIGVNTAVVSGAQGIGFAIPVDHVLDVLARLFTYPRVCGVWFGARFTPGVAGGGLAVAAVEPDSPAAKAGLRAGDRVTALDGEPVQHEFFLRHELARRPPGGKAVFAVARDGRSVTVTMALVAMPKVAPGRRVQQALGLSVQDLTPSLVRNLRLRVDEGVLITDVTRGGPGAAIGLETGDVIIHFGSFRARNIEDMAQVLEASAPGQKLHIRIVRGRYLASAQITIK